MVTVISDNIVDAWEDTEEGCILEFSSEEQDTGTGSFLKDNIGNAGVDFDEDCSFKDIWSKKVDVNIIDDGIVAINYKDNKEIEEKLDKELEDNYIVVVETIYDIKVGIVHEDDEEKDKLDTELADNVIPLNRTILTEVDANVIVDSIVGIGYEDN